jgi:hypothetical protein
MANTENSYRASQKETNISFGEKGSLRSEFITGLAQTPQLLKDFDHNNGLVSVDKSANPEVRDILAVGIVYNYAGTESAIEASDAITRNDGVHVDIIDPYADETKYACSGRLAGLIGTQETDKGVVYKGIALVKDERHTSMLLPVTFGPMGKTVLHPHWNEARVSGIASPDAILETVYPPTHFHRARGIDDAKQLESPNVLVGDYFDEYPELPINVPEVTAIEKIEPSADTVLVGRNKIIEEGRRAVLQLMVEARPGIKFSELVELHENLSPHQVRRLLQKMVKDEKVVQRGKARNTAYHPITNVSDSSPRNVTVYQPNK